MEYDIFSVDSEGNFRCLAGALAKDLDNKLLELEKSYPKHTFICGMGIRLREVKDGKVKIVHCR